MFNSWYRHETLICSTSLDEMKVMPIHYWPLWVSVACFGVRGSVTFHFMCVHINFSSVLVAGWPHFGK